MKVLNIDKLGSKEQRKLVLGGVEYIVSEMTVANFIETTKAAEKIAEEGSLAVQIEETVEMILRSVKKLEKKTLNGLSLEQLQTIVAFVRGDEVDGVEKTEDGEGTPTGN